jgi:hypothetical protein
VDIENVTNFLCFLENTDAAGVMKRKFRRIWM